MTIRHFIITLIILNLLPTFAQIKTKVDTLLLLKTDWVQIDNKPTTLHHCKDCFPNKIVLYRDKTWGNILNKHNDFSIGTWKITGSQITITFVNQPGPTTICNIIDLNKKYFFLEFKEPNNKTKLIKFSPAGK